MSGFLFAAGFVGGEASAAGSAAIGTSVCEVFEEIGSWVFEGRRAEFDRHSRHGGVITGMIDIIDWLGEGCSER